MTKPAVDARRLTHQAAYRPDLLIVTNGVAIGRGLPLRRACATHARSSAMALSVSTPALEERVG